MTKSIDQDGLAARVETLEEVFGEDQWLEPLKDLLLAESELNRAVAMLALEAVNSRSIPTDRIPQGALLEVHMDGWETDPDDEGSDTDRSLYLRAVGAGLFKVLGNDFRPGVLPLNREGFAVNDIVIIGTMTRGKGSKGIQEPNLRHQESVSVMREGRRPKLVEARPRSVTGQRSRIQLALSEVFINNQLVMPLA